MVDNVGEKRATGTHRSPESDKAHRPRRSRGRPTLRRRRMHQKNTGSTAESGTAHARGFVEGQLHAAGKLEQLSEATVEYLAGLEGEEREQEMAFYVSGEQAESAGKAYDAPCTKVPPRHASTENRRGAERAPSLQRRGTTGSAPVGHRPLKAFRRVVGPGSGGGTSTPSTLHPWIHVKRLSPETSSASRLNQARWLLHSSCCRPQFLEFRNRPKAASNPRIRSSGRQSATYSDFPGRVRVLAETSYTNPPPQYPGFRHPK